MLIGDQKPFAIILGCSDSRVPLEMIFDQGLGDLFVIRVAGNIVAPPRSAASNMRPNNSAASLVVVLGHSTLWCRDRHAGTVATCRRSPFGKPAFHRGQDQPSVEGLLDSELRQDPAALLDAAVQANIRASVEQLRQGSEILKHLVQKKELLIVGAEYSLETGVVEFISHSP